MRAPYSTAASQDPRVGSRSTGTTTLVAVFALVAALALASTRTATALATDDLSLGATSEVASTYTTFSDDTPDNPVTGTDTWGAFGGSTSWSGDGTLGDLSGHFSPWSPPQWGDGTHWFDGPTCGGGDDGDDTDYSCDDADLSIDDTSFSWEGPALTHYAVTYCDGTGVSLSYSGQTGHLDVIELDKRIARVEVGAGGSCTRVATQDCECEPDPAPTCELTIAPSTVRSGEHAELSWDTTNGETIAITGVTGIDPSTPEGSVSVAPSQTTTYTGTVTSATGKTATCSATVTVEPAEDNPWCSLGVSPSTITRGDSSTLWWDSNDMTSVDIPGIGTGLTASSTTIVSPSQTTTYTGTFHVRGGGTETCSATLTVEAPSSNPAPTCTMEVSSSRVREDESVTLSWTSDRATSASIDQGIGSVALDGSRSVTVDGATTYTGTFTGSDGRSVTCSARVSTYTGGGGGACMNCGETKTKSSGGSTTKKHTPSPSIVLSQVVTKLGSTITLDQVPYTGFEASPLTVALFWMGIFIASAFIAYGMIAYDPFARLRFALAALGRQPTYTTYDYEAPEAPAEDSTPHVAYFSAASAARNDDGVGMIENLAHEENILLSPEAARMILEACTASREPAQSFVTGLFAAAQSLYAREDGWILLSKERMQAVLARQGQQRPTQAPAAQPAAANMPRVNMERAPRPAEPQRTQAVRTNVAAQPQQQTPRAEQVQAPATRTAIVPDAQAVVSFIDALIANNQQEAFDRIRSFMANGTTVESFIARVVRMLDDVYKNRLEGNHNPDRDLAARTATWSNADFEQVIGMLVESIDRSYASSRIGTKVALAKLFDHFARANG